MTDLHSPTDSVSAMREANRLARASARISLGNSRFQADAEISPLGLLAVGGMVGAMLLAVAPIVRAAVGLGASSDPLRSVLCQELLSQQRRSW